MVVAQKGAYRIPGNNLGKIWIWGVWGSGAIFIVNLMKRVSQQLHGIILLHGEPLTFRLHSPKTRTVIIFILFGPSGNVHDRPNQ